MQKVERDEKRESRIENEAIVDALAGRTGFRMVLLFGWKDPIDPFKARCIE